MTQLLTISESILLLSIIKLGEEAYGVNIRRDVESETGIGYSYGALYSALEQLVKKGYTDKRDGEPTPQRGGRRKSFYKVTNEGVTALNSARELQHKIWKNFPSGMLPQEEGS